MSIARPALAAAPAENMSNSTADACPSESPNGICYQSSTDAFYLSLRSFSRAGAELTGLVLVKKSMRRPIVNGTLIDTALDASRRTIAAPSGFFSGIASATIFRNDDALLVAPSCSCSPTRRVHSGFFGAGGDEALLEDAGSEDEDELEAGERDNGEEERCRKPKRRRGAEPTLGLGRKARHGGLETCLARRAAARAGGRRVGAARMRAGRASIVVGVVCTAQASGWEGRRRAELGRNRAGCKRDGRRGAGGVSVHARGVPLLHVSRVIHAPQRRCILR